MANVLKNVFSCLLFLKTGGTAHNAYILVHKILILITSVCNSSLYN